MSTPAVDFKRFATRAEAVKHLRAVGLTPRMSSMLVSYDRLNNEYMADMVQAAIALETGSVPKYGASPHTLLDDPERIVKRPKG